MTYYVKRQRWNQTYVYRIEKDENGGKKEIYLGNINSLSPDIAAEVETYFKRREYSKKTFTLEEIRSVFKENMNVIVKKFGSVWLIYQIEKKVGAIQIINSLTFKIHRRKTYDTGIYFFIAAVNRLVYPLSKNKIPEWLETIDLKNILSDIEIDPNYFTSTNYWHHWDKLSKEKIESICNTILEKSYSIIKEKNATSRSFFDATNFFTFFSSENKSELAQTGHNKQKRDDLRQIGLACLIDYDTKISLHYKIYNGNTNDAKLFNEILLDLIEQAKKCGKYILTLIFDNGMISDKNVIIIDNLDDVNFITSYSIKELPKELSYYVRIKPDKYEYIDCRHNNRIDEEIKKHPHLQAYKEKSKIKAIRSTEIFWGKPRVFIVTYSEELYDKQMYKFNEHMIKIKTWLNEAKIRYKNKVNGYRNKTDVMTLYRKKAKKLFLSEDFFELTFNDDGTGFSYRKNNLFINDHTIIFGKKVLISDRDDLSTGELVQLYIDKNDVEVVFKKLKNDKCCSVQPIYHWTDDKICCHIGVCIIALSYLQLIEYVLRKNGITESVQSILFKLEHIYSVIISYQDLFGKDVEDRIISKIDPYCQKIFDLFSDDALSKFFTDE